MTNSEDCRIALANADSEETKELKRYAGKDENTAKKAEKEASEGANKNGPTGVTFKKMIESYEQNMK